MLDDVVELDPQTVPVNADEFLLGVKLYLHPEYGYITVMDIPTEDGIVTRVQQLPEPIQNMIPVYLPMILGG